MNEVKVWILVGALTVLSSILAFLAKLIADRMASNSDRVVGKLEEIVVELKQLARTDAIQGEQIQTLKRDHSGLTRRVDEHDQRIRDLEIHKPFNKRDTHEKVEL